MNTLWGSIQHSFATANKEQMLWGIAVLLIMLLLAILHHVWRDDSRKLGRWRLLCMLPLLICAAHFLICVHPIPMLLAGFIPLYLMGILALLPIITAKRRIGHRIMLVPVTLLTALCGFYYCGTAPNTFNHARKSYTESFRAMVQDMNEAYVLKEWKEVDFAALEAKYLPAVEEAEQEQNPAKFADAITSFCCELHDGHVFVSPNYDDSTYASAYDQHEYGLAMVRLDNDEVIAVCTSEDVNKLGIEDGTVITRWNGKPVLQAAAEDVPDYGFPVESNAEKTAVLYLSALGGENVEVSYLDKNGDEKTVMLTNFGECETTHRALDLFLGRSESTENFSAKMLNDKCGYLRLNAEVTDSNFQDIIGYLTGDHKWTREMFREKLSDLKAQGMEYLVVDLRDNDGGFDEIGCALCDLLTDQEWYGQGLGIRKNGQYTCVSDHCIHGTGEFADLQVVALTNFQCASAGDGTSLYLSKLPNVTLAGITDPCGCNQETGGYCVLSGGIAFVGFPTGLILDENGVPNVETKADRISRNPVEERIPFDYDAAMAIFRDNEDYELNWAIRYLEQSAN